MGALARQRALRASRSAGPRGREIDVALPLKGLFGRASRAEVAGPVAGALHNFRSTGLSIETRPAFALADGAPGAFQHQPWQVGGQTRLVSIGRTGLTDGEAFREPGFAGPQVSVAAISDRLVLCGRGGPILYDGMAFAPLPVTTPNGKAAALFAGVLAHHDRLYFWDPDELDFYYGDVGAVAGTWTRFPLSRLGNVTGTIAAMLPLTTDAAFNTNAALCIVTTTGEALVYEGLDPGDATDWRLAGRAQIAAPLGRWTFARVGGDAWMMTRHGVVSLADSLRRGALALVGGAARPIADLIRSEVDAPGAYWTMHVAAAGGQVYLGKVDGAACRQWVYDVEADAWSTTDYPALSWHNLDGETHFTDPQGRVGTVSRARNEGEPVTALWRTGWLRLPGAMGVASITPTILAAAPLEVTVRVLTDHDDTAADRAEAAQTVTLRSDNPADPGGLVSFNDLIAIGVAGSVVQVEMEVTAPWAEVVSLRATLL